MNRFFTEQGVDLGELGSGSVIGNWLISNQWRINIVNSKFKKVY